MSLLPALLINAARDKRAETMRGDDDVEDEDGSVGVGCNPAGKAAAPRAMVCDSSC